MVALSAGLNIAGLALDISGVLLVFLFALPPWPIPDDAANVTYPGTGQKPKITYLTTYRRWARIGLFLLISGFGLQATGSFVVIFG